MHGLKKRPNIFLTRHSSFDTNLNLKSISGRTAHTSHSTQMTNETTELWKMPNNITICQFVQSVACVYTAYMGSAHTRSCLCVNDVDWNYNKTTAPINSECIKFKFILWFRIILIDCARLRMIEAHSHARNEEFYFLLLATTMRYSSKIDLSQFKLPLVKFIV